MNKQEIRDELVSIMRSMEYHIDNGGDYLDEVYVKLEERRNELREKLYGKRDNSEAN